MTKTLKRNGIVKVGTAILGKWVKSPAKPFTVLDRRLIEIEALVRHRGPAGSDRWLRPYADTVTARARAASREITLAQLLSSVRIVAPWIWPEIRNWVDTLDSALEAPGRWTASGLGKVLELTIDERKLLAIRTFRAAGQTVSDQRSAKRERDRARQAEIRKKNKQISREKFIANSVAEEARREGVSRQAIYKRRRMEMQVDRLVANTSEKPIGDQPVNRMASETDRNAGLAHLYAAAAVLLERPRKSA